MADATTDLSGDALFPAYYSPRQRTLDKWRGAIALLLLGLLWATVAMSFLALITDAVTMTDLKELLTIIFGPVVALVGSALGFFFGGGRGGERE